MAKFIGNQEEFHKYIGPRVRNRVQQITLSEKKKANNTCAHCQKSNVELESAHVHGKSRKKIINNLLEQYRKNGFFKGEYLEVDLDKFEEQLISSHQPINEFFIFLCRDCHIKYDSNIDSFSKTSKEVFKQNSNKIYKSDIENEILRVQRRIPRWFKNRTQYNSRILYSFLELYFNNDTVTVDMIKTKANIDTFDQNFSQMKTIAPQNHGKIFEVVGENVELWEPVKEIVLNHYNRYR
jgi:hypothetical protein